MIGYKKRQSRDWRFPRDWMYNAGVQKGTGDEGRTVLS